MTQSEVPQEQGRPARDADAEEGEHLASPDPGYPAEEVQPHEGMPPEGNRHPEDIGDTQAGEGDQATQQPSTPADPESGAD